MASLVWNNQLNPTVDLINIHFNKIDECIKRINEEIIDTDGNCEQTNELIDQFEQLCQLQFKYEEQLLEGLNFPFADEQRILHSSFIETLEPFKLKSNQCHSPSFIKDFIDIRMNLVSNMNHETMKICEFIIDSYR